MDLVARKHQQMAFIHLYGNAQISTESIIARKSEKLSIIISQIPHYLGDILDT